MTAEINMAVAFLLGFGLGFVNSVPIGPITISIVDATFRRGFRAGLVIGFGALAVDVAYCTIGVFGMAAVQTTITEWMRPFSVPILGVLGGRLIYVGFKNEVPVRPKYNAGHTAGFTKGVFILLANPLAMGFWIVVAGTLFAWGWLAHHIADKLIFIAGMTMGTLSWFILLARVVDYKRQNLSDDSIRRISLGAGLLLAAFAIYLGIKSFLIFNG